MDYKNIAAEVKARANNPAPAAGNPAPAAKPKLKELKGLGEWQRIGREMGIIRKINGKLYIPKKGTADYDKINARFLAVKAKGY